MTSQPKNAPKIATVFGGTGFVGRYVVRALARAGYTVKVAGRVPERAFFLRPCGTVGQVVPVHCDYRDPVHIAAALRGSDVVVNCIGILYERKRGDFKRIHTGLPGMIAQACAAAGVGRFVHISALGVEESRSRYAATKLAGEQAVMQAFPAATILRPSVIFGPEDGFFNLFAGLMRFSPVLPLIGGGRTLFQPVYVGDVAAGVLAAATLPLIGEHNPQGRIFELAGPESLSFRDIYTRLFRWTGHRRMLVSVPFRLMKVQAFFLQFIPPRPLLTPDQVISLQTDNVANSAMPGLEDLDVRPTAMELIVPAYLERFRDGGRFSATKQV